MKTDNQLLQQTVTAIEAKVPQELRATFQRVVLAGEKVMYSPQSHDMMIKQLKSSDNPAEAAGEGVAKLFAILLNQSKGTLNMRAAIPAMTVLLCDVLDFMEKSMGVQVTPQLLAAATKEMGSSLLQIMGVTPEKLNQAMSKAGGMQAAQPDQGIVSAAAAGG